MKGPPGPPGGMQAKKSQNPTMTWLPDVPITAPKVVTRQFHFMQMEKKDMKNSIFVTKGITENSNKFIKTLDLDGLDKMFAQAETKKLPVSGGEKPEDKKALISLLDPKRAYGISLQLGSIRGLDYETIRKAILELDETKITEENIGTIKQIVPTNEECATIQGYLGEDELAEPEKFMKALLGTPSYPDRVNSWEVKMKFMGNVASVRPPVENVILGCKELRDSKKFLDFLCLVLTVGNYLNAKNPKKLIYGFKLKSLVKLNETKSADGKTTLLQYICEFIASSKDHLNLLSLPEDLAHIPFAQKIAIGAVEDDIKQMKAGIVLIESYMKIATKDGKTIEGDKYPEKNE